MAELIELPDASARYTFLLIDTCVLLDELQRRSTVLAGLPRGQRRTSVVCLWELLRGGEGAVLGHEVRRDRRRWLDDSGIVAEHLHGNCSKSFTHLVERAVAPPGLGDALLAADALARRWPLVTANVRHFVRIPGLRIVPVGTGPGDGGEAGV